MHPYRLHTSTLALRPSPSYPSIQYIHTYIHPRLPLPLLGQGAHDSALLPEIGGQSAPWPVRCAALLPILCNDIKTGLVHSSTAHTLTCIRRHCPRPLAFSMNHRTLIPLPQKDASVRLLTRFHTPPQSAMSCASRPSLAPPPPCC